MDRGENNELIDLASSLVDRSVRGGAQVAEATAHTGWELTARVRLGQVELLEEAGHRSVALRVMRDDRVAMVVTSDLTPEGLNRCVGDALDLVQLTEPDPDARPADPSLLAREPVDALDLFDPSVTGIEADNALGLAQRAEAAALASDPRLTLSEGASVSRSWGESVLVLSSGFAGKKRGTQVSLSVVPVVEDRDGKRRRGSYYSASRHFGDLESPERIGQQAAQRTLAQLGARRIATTEASVVFSPEAARSLVGTLAGCVLGGALWRKSSYLLGREGTPVASSLVSVVDEPLLKRGFGSRVFDGEGLPCRSNVVIENGLFKTSLLDCTSARKLGRESTASAARHGGALSASISNLTMVPGSLTADELLQDTARGLYVTDMMGFGFNPVTGDFSRGAFGFWIERGRLEHPVSEVTISSNLDTMLRGIDAVACECERKSSIIAPVFRVARMTIAGS